LNGNREWLRAGRNQPDFARTERPAADCSAAFYRDQNVDAAALGSIKSLAAILDQFRNEVFGTDQALPPIAQVYRRRRPRMGLGMRDGDCFIQVQFARPAVVVKDGR
jgi:hypothetical protein